MLQPSAAFLSRARPARDRALAVRRRRDDRRDRRRRRDHPADRIRACRSPNGSRSRGIIPPLTQAQWQAEFANYRRIPEYAAFNAGHDAGRVQGDLLLGISPPVARPGDRPGLCAAAALVRGRGGGSRRAIGWRLVALLALGGLQGAIGWWMVEIRADRPHRRRARLAGAPPGDRAVHPGRDRLDRARPAALHRTGSTVRRGCASSASSRSSRCSCSSCSARSPLACARAMPLPAGR